MATPSSRFKQSPLARAFIHIGLYLCCCAACFAVGTVIEAAGQFRIAAFAYALGLVAYPLFCCLHDIAASVSTYRGGGMVKVPAFAYFLYRVCAVASVATSDSLGEAVVTGAVVTRGMQEVDASKPTRRGAFIARFMTFLFVAISLVEFFIAFAMVGVGEYTSIMLSATAITLGVAVFTCALAPGLMALAGFGRERAVYRARTAWSAGERPVAPGTEHLFARNDEKQRRYVGLPRTIALGNIAYLAVTIAVAAVVGSRGLPYLERVPAVHMLLIALTAVSIVSFIPLLIWWMDCSGRSLTQTIEFDSVSGTLNYTLTNGSGERRTNVTWPIEQVQSYHVGNRCITLHGGQRGGRTRTFFIPRTFDDEGRFIAELERRMVR